MSRCWRRDCRISRKRSMGEAERDPAYPTTRYSKWTAAPASPAHNDAPKPKTLHLPPAHAKPRPVPRDWRMRWATIGERGAEYRRAPGHSIG